MTQLFRLWVILSLAVGGGFAGSCVAGEAAGPLRVHPENGRYFTDGVRLGDGPARAVYLTGSHSWNVLIDRGPKDPPERFDFELYLKFLEENGHNFIRLWSRQVSWYHGYGEGELHAGPLPWKRTGPGVALDGKGRFDLHALNEDYFARLRERVKAASKRGIYVGVMLFGGNYEVMGGWRGNPFQRENNINGIDGDPRKVGNGLKAHSLEVAEVVKLQENYVRRVVVELNGFDNVLFEISNEGPGSSYEWQRHWVTKIREWEGRMPKQHPIGMTALYIEDAAENERLQGASEADWISPLTNAKGVLDMKAAGGEKVSLLDSDHWFVKEIYGDAKFGREWVWKAFCRGYNPILMEHLRPLSFVDKDYPVSEEDAGYIGARRAMGWTRRFADRMNLARMRPRGELSTTRFCLSDGAREYLVYQSEVKGFEVRVRPGRYAVEWFDVVAGKVQRTEVMEFKGEVAGFEGADAGVVVYLRAVE